MLTLFHPLAVDGVAVYQDDQNDLAATPKRAVGFYALPGAPRIALDSDGKPRFRLTVYRRPTEEIALDDAGFAILELGLELTPPDLFALETKLQPLVFGAGDTKSIARVQAAPLAHLALSVGIGGEDGTKSGAFVKSLRAVPDSEGTGALVHADLTQAGATLVDQAVKQGGALPIYVEYRYSLQHLLHGATLHAQADAQLCRALLGTPGLGVSGQALLEFDRAPDAAATAKAVDKLIALKAIRIAVAPAAANVALTAADVADYTQVARDQLVKNASALFAATPLPQESEADAVQKFEAGLAAAFNWLLDGAALERAVINAVVLAGPVPPPVFVDLQPKVMKVEIATNLDWSVLPIDHIDLTVTYSGAETTTATFTLKSAADRPTFQAFTSGEAAPSYDWSTSVYYKDGGAPYVVGRKGERARALYLDASVAGLYRVDVSFGLVPLDRYPSAHVKLRYDSKALGRQVTGDFVLDKTNPSATWIVGIGQAPIGNYQYQVDWTGSDGKITSTPWIDSPYLRLLLDSPHPARLVISVIAAEDFAPNDPQDWASVQATLRYDDPANQVSVENTLTLTTGAVTPWSVDLVDPKLVAYRYRYAITYRDGTTRAVPADPTQWLDGTPGFLILSEHYDLMLNVVPFLLRFDGKLSIATASFSYDDPAKQLHLAKTFEFDAQHNQPVRWRAVTGQSGDHTVTLNMTYYGTDHSTVTVPPMTSTARIWVLPPPPPDAFK